MLKYKIPQIVTLTPLHLKKWLLLSKRETAVLYIFKGKIISVVRIYNR